MLALVCILVALDVAVPASSPVDPPSPGSVSHEPLVLALRDSVSWPDPERRVRLEDVAEVVSDPQGVWKLLKMVVIPSHGRDWVGWNEVRHRLRGAGLPLARVQLRGPGVCELQRETRDWTSR